MSDKPAYKLLSGHQNDLPEKVTNCMGAGFVPYGQPYYSAHTYLHYQAMIYVPPNHLQKGEIE